MGYAGVINIAGILNNLVKNFGINVIYYVGIRIGGISGIYKGNDYLKGHFEKSPYNENSKRSVYHIRNLEVFRLKQIKQPLDVFLSHDWPTGICDYGDKTQLLRFKPFFK